MGKSNMNSTGGLTATLNGLTLPTKGKTAKSFYGTIHTARKHCCLYIGGGYFLTSYTPAKGTDTIQFDGDLHPFVVYVPVFRPTRDCVVVIYAPTLKNVRSFVRLTNDVPDQMNYNKSRLYFPKMRPTQSTDFREDIKECDYWRELYGVEKFQLPMDKVLKYHSHQTEVIRNGTKYGVLAYHKKQNFSRGNRYGGVRYFTAKTLECEYYLIQR